MNLQRRQFLKTVVAGSVTFATGAFHPGEAPAKQPNHIHRGFDPDLDISLTAAPAQVPILPGSPTQVWRYNAEVLKGAPQRIKANAASYLGPIIRAKKGEKVRVRFNNRLPTNTIVHWHGLHVPAVMDGHPRYVIPTGQSYLYEFEVKNRAGTYWYHPHPHGETGYQIYGGLAGLFIVADDEEEAAGLPQGEYDIPLILQDRTFDADNQLVYLTRGQMEMMSGFIGDKIMVNGRSNFSLPVSTRSYRLRLLNGSNSRIYKLAWQDGRPLTVIGTDGGLLKQPTERRYAYLSPGERVELWIDFSDDPIGFETSLVSLPFETGTGRMGGGMMMGRRGLESLPNGSGFPIFAVEVQKRVREKQPLPQRLSHIGLARPKTAINYYSPRRFTMSMNHMRWAFNGRTFQMDEVADDESVRLGTSEVWEFFNTGSGMGMMGRGMGMMNMMNMPHPIHLHGQQFQVLERGGVTHSGYIDEGWKDTVLLMPGEQVRILVDFDDYPGLFLYHCHNLEHGDMGMMRNFFVRS